MSERSRSLYLSIRRAIKQIVVIIGAYQFCQLLTKFRQHLAVNVNSIFGGNYWGSSSWFRRNRPTADHIFCICQILEKKWEHNKALHQLFIDFKKAYDSVRREVLYNFLIVLVISMKLERLMEVCRTETYSRARVGKNLSDMFPIRNVLKQGDALSPLLFNFALVTPLGGFR